MGFIAGWGAHPLDIAQWGLDTDDTGPVRYEGTGKIPPKGSLWDTIESWDVQCEYANGVKMHFMGRRVAEPIVKAYHPAWCDHGTTFFGNQGLDQRQPRGALRQRQGVAERPRVKPERST